MKHPGTVTQVSATVFVTGPTPQDELVVRHSAVLVSVLQSNVQTGGPGAGAGAGIGAGLGLGAGKGEGIGAGAGNGAEH